MTDIRDISAAFPLCRFFDIPLRCNMGAGGSQCLSCHRTKADTSQIPAPQNNARPPTLTTPWQRMGLVTLVNFQTEEAIEEVFARLDIDVEHRTIYRTPSGSLRGSGVLWNRNPAATFLWKKGKPNGMD